MKTFSQEVSSIRRFFDIINSVKLFFKRDKLRILIIGICIIYFIYLSSLATIRALSFDEARHVIRSMILYRYFQQVLKNPAILSPNQARNFLYGYYGGVYHVPYAILFHYPPLYPLLTFFIFLFLGISEYSARFIAILSSAIIPVLLYEIGKLMYNRRVGIIATLLMISFFELISARSQALLEGPLTLLGLCSLYFFYGAIKNNNTSWFNYSGLFLGLSLLMKQTGILIALIIGLFFIFNISKEILSNDPNFSMKKHLLDGLRIFSFATVVAGPWYFFLAIKQPQFLFSIAGPDFSQNISGGISFITRETSFRSISWGSAIVFITGILTGALGMIGIIYCLWRRNKSDEFVLFWLIGFLEVFIYLPRFSARVNLRHIIPGMPAFFLCASIIIDFLFLFFEKMEFKRFKYRNRAWIIISVCFCVIFLIQISRTSVLISEPANYDRTYVPIDETIEYIVRNTPQSKLRYRVLQIGWSNHFSPYAFMWYMMKNDNEARIEYWLLHDWETTPSQSNSFVMKERMYYIVIYVETGHWGDLKKPLDLDTLAKMSVEYSIAAHILKDPKYTIEKSFEGESFFIFIAHPSMVL